MIDGSALASHAGLMAAGLSAGFLNVMAGGGSMLTLPALMLLGMPADVANGTNRLSIVSQSATGVLGFHRGGALDRAAVVEVLVPTVAGSLVGALTAAQVPPRLLKLVLLGTMLAVAVTMMAWPRAIAPEAGSAPRWRERRLGAFAGLFGAGLYGGFVQAGVGFVLLGVLGGVLRYDLVRANALKLVCTLVFGSVAFGVFAAFGQVAWLPAALLAVYTTAGSLLGVKFALRVPQAVLRWIVFVAVVAVCVAALMKG